jgi:hypothetical protein
MKIRVTFSSVVIGLMCLSLLIPAAGAEQSDRIDVEAAAICESVENREAINVGTRFTHSTPRLYCFTKIVGAESPTEVVHVWRYGDVERARVSLAVNESSWRTYSSKAIQAHEIGAWHVDVLDTSGNLLETIDFEVTQ